MSRVTVREAYAFCRQIAHKHGANFSVGFRFLPRQKRNAVYAAYAFCRWADDIADEPGDDVAARLDQWSAELERCYGGQPEHTITVALHDALKHFAIPKSAFAALIAGCKQDLLKSRYETFDELLGYCELVATSISDISLPIFEYRTPAALEHGRNLAIALQLTNITRDIGDDLPRDRIYIPQEELRRFGLSDVDVIERRESAAMRELVLLQVARAEDYFRAAEPLLRELAFDARFPTLLMGAIYSRVLAKIRRDPLRPLRQRISLPKAEKIAVVLRTLVRPHFV